MKKNWIWVVVTIVALLLALICGGVYFLVDILRDRADSTLNQYRSTTGQSDTTDNSDFNNLEVIIDDLDQMPESDEVLIHNAEFVDGKIKLTVLYSGCEDHTFKFYVNKNALESYPVQNSAMIYHNQHGNYCERANTTDLMFDVSELFAIFGDKINLTIIDSTENEYLLLLDESQINIGLANPASVYCVENDGISEIRETEDGQTGYCIFADGSECEEWAFYRGECE